MTLAESYDHCRSVAKTQAGNFYYSFTLLPPEKRAAMCAVYAFMRHSDDISDEESADKGGRLASWRRSLDRAFLGEYAESRILPAFHDTVKRYEIPAKFFHELIDGAEMDLTTTRYETFEQLYQYCYRVACTVGFVCLHVWGFKDGAYAPAEACGIAFQLTNILRDIKEDAQRGRIYLPLDDLHRFDYREDELIAGVVDSRFHSLMQFEVARAREFYDRALALPSLLTPEGRTTFQIMYRIYRGILDRIEAQDYDVFSTRAKLSTARKVSIVAGAWLSSRFAGA
jgi:phytoene synthase